MMTRATNSAGSKASAASPAGWVRPSWPDFLILAHTAWLAGDPDRAAHLAGLSLELQPYYPNAFRFLTMVYEESDPDLAQRYLSTYDYILNQTTEGFRIEYPPLPE